MRTGLKALVIAALLAAILLPRIFNLDAFRAPDEDRWIARTAGFTRSLAHGQFDKLLQSPTPGVTTHWLGALTVRFDDWQTKKLPLALGQSFLILIAGYLAWRLWGKWTAAILTLLLALNPHLIAHARIYGTDALMPVFIVISFLSLFLWEKQKSTRYLVLSGFTTAAAVLSKLPGIIFLPIMATYIILCRRNYELRVTSYELRNLTTFTLSFLLGLILILPSLALAPMSIVGDFLEIFRSAEYTEAHTLGFWYYPRMLLFISTPLELLAIAFIPAAIYLRRRSHTVSPVKTNHLLFVILSAIFFFAIMSYGSKKGHRYLVPVFTLTDLALVMSFDWITRARKHTGFVNTSALLLAGASAFFLWQAVDVTRLHPHVMAYTNPLTRPWFNTERYGWGEGLDLAAAYLNSKPNATSLVAASMYPNEFGHYFQGETKPVHQHDEGADYVIIYRAMFDRGPAAWETDVVNQYKLQIPENIISLGGVEMIWIYKK